MSPLRAVFVVVAVVATGLFPAVPAGAATLLVSTTADDTTTNGNCTLREAVIAANTDSAVDACPAGSGADTITLSAGTYMLDEPGALEDDSLAGDLDIATDLTITGAGKATTTIDGTGFGAAPDRLIQVLDPGATLSIGLSNLTLRDGDAPDGRNGGAFKVDGPVAVTFNSVGIASNTATCDNCPGFVDGNGGGIYFDFDSDGSTLSITNSTITNNAADCSGGGLGFEGDDSTITLSNTSLSNNLASCEGAGAEIDNEGGSTAITGGTISGNALNCNNCAGDDLALLKGGGVSVNNGGLSVASTTFTNNSVTAEASCDFCNPESFAFGGALYFNSIGEQLAIQSTQITGNNVSATTAGQVGNPAARAAGGGVYEDLGTLVADTTTISNNNAVAVVNAGCDQCGRVSAAGAGLYHYESPASFVSGTVANNNASVTCAACLDFDRTSTGGGIHNELDPLTLTRASIQNNTALCNGCGLESIVRGGGLHVTDGQVTATESTFSANQSLGGGGAWLAGGSLALTNSTISSNGAGCTSCGIGGASVAGDGGGIGLAQATATSSFSTITGNNASGAGGGLLVLDNATATLGSTIIAHNGAGGDCKIGDGTSGAIVSTGYNLGSDATCSLTQPTDLPSTLDAGLLPLALNAPGTTATHALKDTSPALDAASPSCPPPATDQRGVARPTDGPDENDAARCDIGAYELATAPALELSPVNASHERGTATSVTATLRAPDGSPISGVPIRFTVTGANPSATTIVTGANGQATFAYTGSAIGTDSISAYADLDSDDEKDASEPSATATRTWSGPIARFISCTESLNAETGTTVMSTCTVTSAAGSVVPGVTVTFSSTGVGSIVGATSVDTDQQGRASASATSQDEGQQQLSGSISSATTDCERSLNDPAGAAAGTCTDTTAIAWSEEILEADTLDLTPSSASASPGDEVTLVAEVLDADGQPLPDIAIEWSIPAPLSAISTENVTDADGRAVAVVTSLERGEFTVGAAASPCTDEGGCSDTAFTQWGKEGCDIVGTDGDDVLQGSPGPQTICGFGGADLLRGQSGHDKLIGGGGDDTLKGGKGKDVLRGRAGDDELDGGVGQDDCRGGSGNDTEVRCE